MQDNFPRGAVLSMGEDIAGNLWIGTRRSGLLRMGSSRFQTFGATEGLQLGQDQLLLEAQSGQVSAFDVGGERTQVYRQEGGRRFGAILPALPEPVRRHAVRVADGDGRPQGAWWFSTVFGLFRFPTLGGWSDLRLLSECAVDRFF